MGAGWISQLSGVYLCTVVLLYWVVGIFYNSSFPVVGLFCFDRTELLVSTAQIIFINDTTLSPEQAVGLSEAWNF